MNALISVSNRTGYGRANLKIKSNQNLLTEFKLALPLKDWVLTLSQLKNDTVTLTAHFSRAFWWPRQIASHFTKNMAFFTNRYKKKQDTYLVSSLGNRKKDSPAQSNLYRALEQPIAPQASPPCFFRLATFCANSTQRIKGLNSLVTSLWDADCPVLG